MSLVSFKRKKIICLVSVKTAFSIASSLPDNHWPQNRHGNFSAQWRKLTMKPWRLSIMQTLFLKAAFPSYKEEVESIQCERIVILLVFFFKIGISSNLRSFMCFFSSTFLTAVEPDQVEIFFSHSQILGNWKHQGTTEAALKEQTVWTGRCWLSPLSWCCLCYFMDVTLNEVETLQ